MDKTTERALRDALAGLEGPERHYVDQGTTPAIYRIEPPGHEAVVALHGGCPANDGQPFVTVKLGTPTRPDTKVQCSGCGDWMPLDPPAEVLAYGRSGLIPGGLALPH